MSIMEVRVQLLLFSWYVALGVTPDAIVASQYCNPFTQGPNDPKIPQLPDQYQAVIEGNIVDRGMTVTAHEYFDSGSSQATLILFTNNTQYNLIYDYANDQLFYVTGHSCEVRNLEQDDNNIFFGNVTYKGGVHSFTTGGALYFAKTFGEQYNGTSIVRGITTDVWIACVYWAPLKSNFTLEYHFTAQNWSDPVQTAIPVRAVAKGIQIMQDGTSRNFLHYYDYIDFQLAVKDSSVFQTPKGVVCIDRKKTKPIPQLPSFYHYRQEIVREDSTNVFEADVWYDQDYRLIRFDYRQPTPVDPVYTTNPLSEVHDYNFGVRYIRDAVQGNCTALPLSNSSFDAVENTTLYLVNGSYSLHMKDPLKLFYLDNTYAYTGQRMARGLMCDVFTALRYDYPVPGYGPLPATFEYYFLQDNIQEYPDDGDTTDTQMPILLDVRIDTIAYHATYNFLDFDGEHPDISVFDVSSCFSEDAKLQFRVRFPGKYKRSNNNYIRDLAQRVFYETMNVKPLRVQDVRLDYDNSNIYISATLLDRSPYAVKPELCPTRSLKCLNFFDLYKYTNKVKREWLQLVTASEESIDVDYMKAEFTFLSGMEIEKYDDLVYASDLVNKPQDCAKMCVTNPNFICNSFDFCSQDPTGTCRLSKRHIGDGIAVPINSTCDHFSRTVNGPAMQELQILDAYNNLLQNVYSQQVQIMMPDGTQYVAVDMSVTFGWISQAPVPSLTGQFSYNLEMILPSQKAVYNTRIWYDYEYKLVRYDLVNTQANQPFYTPITTIHDFNKGLAYDINNDLGNCTVTPITNNSFDVGLDNSSVNTLGAAYVKMKSPLDLFYLNSSYRFAGQKTVRGMLCDVFEAKQMDFPLGTQVAKANLQFYFLTDAWNELSQESGTPVNTQPIKLVVDAVNSAFSLTYNFFDFNEQHPDLSNFNVLPCFTGDQQKMFLITFQGLYHPTLDGRLRIFQKNVRLTLAAYLSVSPLRFQNAQITFQGNQIYYTATMVEQAPVILDFIKSSSQVGIYTVDKNYYSISNPMDCASRCRSETSFRCQSFDYCPAVQICQLSRILTPDGSKLNANQSCDHYSQAVNNQNAIEVTVSQAFIALRDLVYKNLLNISIQTNSMLIIFPATAFASNMLPKDVNQTIGNMNLLHFTANRHDANYATSDAQTQGGSVDQCAAQCINQGSFNCQGFSYCYDTGVCQLSKTHPDQSPPLLPTQSNQCDVYGRNYVDSYVISPGVIPITMHDTAVTNIPDVNTCARQCTSYNAYTCKSFDYCPGTMNCYLRKSRALVVSPVSLTASGQCSHYKRNYLSDFTLSSTAQPIMVGQNLLFANVTVEDCSKLCVENSGSDCKSFAYCGATSSCRILSSQTVSNSGVTTQPLQGCNLYTRQYFQSSSSPLTSNTVQDVTTGYNGAAMAGIAIGMFIPGMVLGAALLYFLRTKKLVEQEQYNMSTVNTSHGKSDDENEGNMGYDNVNYANNQYDTPHEDEA